MKSRSILESDDLVTVEELAKFLRVTRHAIYMQRLRGQEPGSLRFRPGQQVMLLADGIHWIDRARADHPRD